MTKILRHFKEPIDRVRYQDHFELIYLRHGYFRRSENPEPDRLAQFEEMICNISDKFYMRNIEIFKTVGFEMDDLRNAARVHTVSFLSMSGLKENPDKFEKFRKRHKKIYGKESEPKEGDMFKKDCYDLAKFLNQRMQEVAQFSERKNKNIRGTKSIKKFYIGDPSRNPTDVDLYESPEVFGYKSLTQKQYKDLVDENNAKGKTAFLTKDNKMIRAVYLKGSFLRSEDIINTDFNPINGCFFRSPEDNLMIKEAIFELDKKNLYKKK